MNELWNRIQREVKTNAKKAALLVALLLFGCCIWIPMLTRAACSSRRTVATTARQTSVSQPAMIPNIATDPAADPSAKSGEFWSNLATALADDPMFQTADVQSLTRNPFQIAEVPQPLPVLFAAEPATKALVNTEVDAKGLELRSTIISRTRRAAMINGQLYHLGRKIQTESGPYQLTRIESNRVVLSSGEQTIELTLSRPQLKDVWNRDTAQGPPMQ